ncbi:transcription termination/antitermination protein NusG [Anatilimnocola floriformis]|uniref:transcription termination/antitermination protein NusG n=1 Tax=Anatilimnocola floriformis TaxID=2948575 RepID=UPI0020C4609A|nr:transcription termination/antitermination protein NusG [Anatilimnocola floriformis]
MALNTGEGLNMYPDSPENPEPVAPEEAGAAAVGPGTSSDPVPPVEPVAATADNPAPESSPSPEVAAAASQTGDEPAAVVAEAEEEEVEDEPEVEYPAQDPLEFIDESQADNNLQFDWYILKIQVNREDSIRDALLRRIKMNGVERYFKEVVVPTEDVAEFTKTGKRRVVKKKLYPGYLLINMAVNDESWFAIRETAGIGDFTGSGGKPTPMLTRDVEQILRKSKVLTDEATPVKSTIPFKKGDKVRVKEGNFQNFDGEVGGVDQANGRVKVLIQIFGRTTEVEFQHWQIELV